MNTDELKDYIHTGLKEGKPMGEIKGELLGKGVTAADIDWAANAARLEANPAPPPPEVKPASPWGILIGLFFIGYGAFRLSQVRMEWDRYFGWILIVLGIIRVGATIAGMSKNK
jgi:hypothetical protein